MFRRAVALTVALVSATVLPAHPEIDEALARLNARLAATPTAAALYLERGELYAQHDDWVAAEANYRRAAELAPDLPRLALARGALALATAQPAEARTHFDRALVQDPRNAEARVLRARTLARLGERAAALADYDVALALLAAPAPDFFLERAALCATPAEALRGLESGLSQLGPVPALVERALTLELTLGRFDAALARIDAQIDRSERRETWMKRRGDVLVAAGRPAEARAAYAAALAAVRALPAWLAAAPDTARLSAELVRLAAVPSS